MQLIYLYIDNYNYKNIQKQGFNFSPKYKCSFCLDFLYKIEDINKRPLGKLTKDILEQI